MTSREIYLGTVAALAEFIRTNRTFPLPSDYGDGEYVQDPRAIMDSIDGLAAGQDRSGDDYWDLKAVVLEMFLRKAADLSDVFRPVSASANSVSRDAVFDPLTWRGLCDVLHFINNGLLDDDWIALYENDGERRVVGEAIDDAVQMGRSTDGIRGRVRLDHDDAWLAGSKRDVLTHKNFMSLFAGDVAEVAPSVPSQSDLMDLWMARVYEDFSNSIKRSV